MDMAATLDELPHMSSSEEGDAELMRRVGRGDAVACRVLVDRHLGSIMRFAHRLIGDATEAEDVAQDTFLRLWRHADRWEPKAKLTTWLHRVAYNLAVDRLRARRDMPVAQLPERADARSEAPAQMEQQQTSKAVNDALASLAERQRTAIALVYYQGLSNREAADVMGVQVDALESLLARGRRALRSKLADDAPDGQRDEQVES